MRFHRMLFLICILACASLYATADDDTWCEVKSPNFIIISNASIGQARQVAKSLEQFRAVFQSTLPTLRVDPGFPLIVFAARDGLSFEALLPNDRKEKGAAQLKGFFLSNPDKNIAVLRADARGDQRYHVIYHEYVHMVMNLNFQNLPLWLSEGLAEFYAFATISNGASGFGRTNRESLEMLKRSSMIPLPTLMAVTHDSPYYRQQNKSRVFYAQSWVLTHYLILGDKQAHARQLIEFLRLIKNDVSEQEAAERSFGDLKVLQHNLEKYIRLDKFYYVPVETSPSVKENRYAARKLSQAESLALRGDLLIRTNRLDEAMAVLEQALQLNPRNAVANEGMGLLFLKLQNQEQSQKYFSTAAELDSNSFLAQYYAAGLAYSKNKDYRATENYLCKALAINPKFVPAYHMLSQTLMLQGTRLSEALELAMKAANLEPGESSHWINVGQILIVMGRYDEAKRIGERRLAIARTEAQRRQAEWLLSMIYNRQDRMLKTKQRAETLREDVQKIEAQQSAAGELKTPLGNQAIAPLAPEIEAGPAGKVEGVIRSVKCDYPAIMDVVLDSNGKQHRLHAENYHQVQYRMGGSPEKSEFRPCEELEGMRVQIEFLSVLGQEHSGLIKTVIIEK